MGVGVAVGLDVACAVALSVEVGIAVGPGVACVVALAVGADVAVSASAGCSDGKWQPVQLASANDVWFPGYGLMPFSPWQVVQATASCTA
jgi:hypothetical protein